MQNTNISTDLSPHGYFLKGLSLHHSQQFDEALDYINMTIILSNNSPFYIYQKIKFLYTSEDYEACYSFIISQFEWLYKNASLYILCRTISYYQSIKKLSIPLLEDTLEAYGIPSCLADSYELLLKKPPHILKRLIQKAIVQDQYVLALNYIALIERNTSLTADLLYLKGYAYHMLGQLENAHTAYLAYSEMMPHSASSFHHIGMVLMEMKYYHSACKNLEQALRLESDNITYALHLGECYYVSQKYTLAAKLYENLHKRFPTNLQISFNLMHTYKTTHHFLHSRKYAKQIKKQLYTPRPEVF